MRLVWIGLGLIGALIIYLILNGESSRTFGLNNSEFAQVALFSMWGALIGSAIIPRQGGVRIAARNAAAWIFIVLALVSGYEYRTELQSFASRVTGGLMPGRPTSTINSNGTVRVEIGKSSNDHFSVAATINGQSVDMLVDTGASAIVLAPEDAIRAGIDLSSLSYVVPVNTANGRSVAAQVRLTSVQVGEIERLDIAALVAREGALDKSLLGMSFLGSLQKFEFSGDRLILTD